MIKKALNLVVEKMLLREQREDVGQLVLLVKIIRKEAENLRKEKQEHLVEKRKKGYMVGLSVGVDLIWVGLEL
jgi:hypothetical protein